MESRVTEQFRRSFVRISTEDEIPVGAGFLVSDDGHMLTCAHVVAAALRDDSIEAHAEIPQGTVNLNFHFLERQPARTARVVRWQPRVGPETNPSGDIAVLQSIEDLPDEAQPIRLTTTGELFGHRFRAHGFPHDTNSGVWVYGVVRDPLGNGWLQVEGTKEQGKRIERGFSGGPVQDRTTGRFVGMVAASSEYVKAAKVGYVIPTQMLACAWPDLRVDNADRIRLGDTAPPLLGSLWNVPYAKNRFFTGRAEILDGIRGTLEDTSTAAVTQAISGLGGIGKTQTAVEYAYRHRDNYEAIFWAVADDEATITSAYAEIARLLNLPEAASPDQNRIVETVKRWFETNEGWLLILDNADSPSLLKPLLPLSPHGHILITSRAQNLDMVGIPRTLDLQEMSPDEALEFLLKRTGRQDTDTHERRSAAELAENLGYLPLALEQAGAYIAAHQARFDDYLASFRIRQLKLLEASPPVAGDYPSLVSTTWSLNFEEIEQVSTASADLLRLSTFLSPGSVPLELITRGASETGPTLSAALAHVREDPIVMASVLEPLIRYSLIRRDIESNTYSVHRLVQETVKAAMDQEFCRIWALRAVKAINSVFPSASYDTWPLCDRLLSHSVQAAKLVEDFGFQYADSGDFLNGLASYLRMLGDFGESERLHLQALAIAERDLGPDDSCVATHLNNLASVYLDQYRYSKAEPLFVRALEIWEKALGADDPELSLSCNNLGFLYVRWGRYEKAQPLLKRALKLEKNLLEPEEFFFATILNNLAELHLGLDEFDEAEELCKKGLGIREMINNPEKTGRSYVTMATILLKKREYGRSEEFFELALANREAVYSSNHPELIQTLTRYAELLRAIGRNGEATHMERRIEAIRSSYSIHDAY